MKAKLLRTGVIVSCTLALSACVVAQPQPYYATAYQQPVVIQPAPIYVRPAPPEVYVRPAPYFYAPPIYFRSRIYF